MYHPAHRLLLRRARPEVKLLDVRDDVADLTTYTFTDVNIGDLGAARIIAQSQMSNVHTLRSPSNKAIVINVHAEDDAITYTVSSCTLGGVAGLKTVDRGGGTNAINSAQFIWSSAQLEAIANTNVVVTFSEAVTTCAIGVMSIDNLSYVRSSGIGTSSSTGTGAINVGGSSTSVENGIRHVAAIMASTHATGGGTAHITVDPYRGSSGDGTWQPTILYEGSNAEMDFAGAWTFIPGIALGPINSAFLPGFTVDWSGAAAFDACCSTII